MNAPIENGTLGVPPRSFGHLLRIYYLEARLEFLRMLRYPGFFVPILAFPVMFYLFFGVLFAHGEHSVEQATWSLAGLATFGVIGPGLFGFGIGFALDRGLGWMQVKRASPMPPSAYLFAKVFMSMLFAFIVVALLSLLGAGLSHIRLAPGQWLSLFVILVLGSVPFCALGLAIGAWSKPQAAPAIANAIFLPMSFLSGLWVPLMLLPGFMEKIAMLLPAYHLGKLAFGAVGVQQGVEFWPHVLALAGFTVFFLLLARRGYRRGLAS